MKKTRVLGLVVGASLVVAVILIALGFNAAPEALGSSSTALGIGDVRRFEAQPASLAGDSRGSGGAYVTMADVLREDARPALLVSAAQESSPSYVGLGEVRRFEAIQAVIEKVLERSGR
jgi:hypothetical protein